MKKQDIFIILIVLGLLGVLINHINKAARETAEVMQYTPHIMDTPPGIDLSDTMVFYNNL